MKEKYYDGISTLVIGILFILLGFVLIIGGNKLYKYITYIVVIVFIGRVILDLVKYIFRKGKRKQHFFLSWIFHFGICFIFCFVPNISFSIIPITFSFYLILIGISNFMQCFLEIRDKVYVHFRYVFVGLIYLCIALPILSSPVKRISTFIVCFAIYIILLGISYVLYTIERLLSIVSKNKLKRRIRLTLPKIVEAIIPYSIMMEINRNLEINKLNHYDLYDDDDCDVSLHILIHTSNRGNNKIGHMDIIFDGKVYSYGNYDEGSRRLNEMFGDGVLFVTNKINNYINFCIDNSGKTIFDFGIRLNDKEKLRVLERIKELCSYTYVWNCQDDLKYGNGNSYAGKLYKKTGAKFFKFNKTKYKTYFILGTNCCYLVDDIIGNSGMDILSINGIITPGTYYDYLNREFRLKKSKVVFKDIYNVDRRP